jgi:death on curing protein
VRETFYPTIEEALYLHNILLREFGGATGVLDMGLLESALGRPKSGYYSSLTEQAAALLQSLALNHPFVDGNKRVAFALTAIFLKLNGVLIKVHAAEGVKFIEQDLISKRISLSEITRWIERHLK